MMILLSFFHLFVTQLTIDKANECLRTQVSYGIKRIYIF